MKNFTDVFEQIKAEASKTRLNKEGNEVSKALTFSRTDFEKLAKAYVNTPEYITEHVALKEGELVKTEITPVKEFRGMIKLILEDFGVDKQESERIMTDAYQLRNVKGLYHFVSELLYSYMQAGKKFDFITKEDFMGSIFTQDCEEGIKEYNNPKTGEKVNVKREKHSVLKVKAKCPAWRKSNVQ